MKDKLHILQHSLGVDQYGEGRQYRNHFVTGEGSKDFSNCRSLAAEGMMTEQQGHALSGGDSVFRVTPKGIDYVALNSPPEPKLTRSQKNYQSYLDADCGFSFGEWMRFKRTKA